MYLRLLITSLVWFALNLLVYYTALHFFRITNVWVKRLLKYSVVVLSISTVSSIVAMRSFPGALTQAYYTAASLWTGAVLYFAGASVLSWFAYVVLRVAKRPTTNIAAITALFMGIALAYSAYGAWSAFNPEIKNVEVKIPNLPLSWEKKTVVQISDMHLGAIHTPRRFDRIVGIVNGLKPDIVFITGDLFDGMTTDSMEDFTQSLNGLIARDAVFFINGNHEHYIGANEVARVIAKTKYVHLVDRAVTLDGVQIVGVDFPGPEIARDVNTTLLQKGGYKTGLPTILLYHTPTNIEQKEFDFEKTRENTYWSPDVNYTLAKSLGISLQLSGHTHCGQVVPFNLLTAKLYQGFDKGLNSDGDYFVYTSCGTGTFGPPMRTGNRGEITVLRLKGK